MACFTEHPNWQQLHPLGPVTFDGECSHCHVRIEDAPLDPNGDLTKGTLRLTRCRKGMLTASGVLLRSKTEFVVCNNCYEKPTQGDE